MWGRAFYCVSDARYFLGTVALLNSLRLVGNEDPLVVLDCGLERWQRRLLDTCSVVVDPPPLRSPRLAKWAAPLEHPAAVTVIVDADILVVSSLLPLLGLASAGDAVAFEDVSAERFHGDAWSEAVGVESLERIPYVNAGFVILAARAGGTVLERLRDVQERVDVSRSRGFGRGGSLADPFHFADQDTWNAVLAAEIGRRLVVLPRRAAPAPPFADLRLVDAASLECEHADGTRPHILHHWQQKPWLERCGPNPYSDLLPRVLTAADVELRLKPGQLPLWLRGRILRTLDRYAYAIRFRSRAQIERARSRLILPSNPA